MCDQSLPPVNDREALESSPMPLGDPAPEIERDVRAYRKNSQDRELIADLFRAIHNVQGRCCAVQV